MEVGAGREVIRVEEGCGEISGVVTGRGRVVGIFLGVFVVSDFRSFRSARSRGSFGDLGFGFRVCFVWEEKFM